METNNIETCKYIELNGIQLCCFTNGNIYKIKNNGDMRHIKGNKHATNYLQAHINHKQYYIHRIIGFAFLGLDITDTKTQIDHKNHIRYDNRVDNLRIVSHQQNNWNKENVKGYYWNKLMKKWGSRIRIAGNQRLQLGYFDNELDAKNAYLEAKQQYHII